MEHWLKMGQYFKAYKKSIKYFFTHIKILTGYYRKNKEGLQKQPRDRHQKLSEEEKKSENIPVKDIKIFPKKKKIKNFSIVMNAIKIFLKMKNRR